MPLSGRVDSRDTGISDICFGGSSGKVPAEEKILDEVEVNCLITPREAYSMRRVAPFSLAWPRTETLPKWSLVTVHGDGNKEFRLPLERSDGSIATCTLLPILYWAGGALSRASI